MNWDKCKDETGYDVPALAKELAKEADLKPEQALRVLEVLGISKVIENHQTASSLIHQESTRRALGIASPPGGRLMPDFSFKSLGLSLHDATAALRDIDR